MEENQFNTGKNSLALMVADPSAVAAGEAAKARIQCAYIMALQKPRNEFDARDRILKACKRTEFAGRAEYAKPIGGKKIFGPSIRFAELALREWGNIMSEVTTLYEDDNIRRIRVSMLDLETNAQFTKDIQIAKTIERKSKKNREDDVVGERKNTYGEKVYILKATDEEMFTKESSWASRVIRNEGLRLIPTDIINEGMETARATIANRATQDPAAETKRILDSFSGLGIGPAELEKYLKHPIATISPPELVDLRSVYQSIRDGESVWNDHVATKETDGAPDGKGSTHPTAFNERYEEVPAHLRPDFDDYMKRCAANSKLTMDQMKVMAAEYWHVPDGDDDSFYDQFLAWKDSQPATPKRDPHKTTAGHDPAYNRPPADKGAEDKPAFDNWWDDDKHWKYRRGEKFKAKVTDGIKSPADDFHNLRLATQETRNALRAKFEKAFGKEAFNALVMDPPPDPNQLELLEQLKLVPGDIQVLAIERCGFKPPAVPDDPADIQKVLDAVAKIEVEMEAESRKDEAPPATTGIVRTVFDDLSDLEFNAGAEIVATAKKHTGIFDPATEDDARKLIGRIETLMGATKAAGMF